MKSMCFSLFSRPRDEPYPVYRRVSVAHDDMEASCCSQSIKELHQVRRMLLRRLRPSFARLGDDLCTSPESELSHKSAGFLRWEPHMLFVGTSSISSMRSLACTPIRQAGEPAVTCSFWRSLRFRRLRKFVFGVQITVHLKNVLSAITRRVNL
jgi:hypothetical protein